jgi:hypothetical protein
MKNLPTAEEARQWLVVQLDLLTELKTTNARDSGFQQWRNNTIALAERIWPHQQVKYKRFRRIPFQPSSVKANDRARRESFEKGCAEARRILQLWIAEINLHGLLHAGEGSGAFRAAARRAGGAVSAAVRAGARPAPVTFRADARSACEDRPGAGSPPRSRRSRGRA